MYYTCIIFPGRTKNTTAAHVYLSGGLCANGQFGRPNQRTHHTWVLYKAVHVGEKELYLLNVNGWKKTWLVASRACVTMMDCLLVDQFLFETGMCPCSGKMSGNATGFWMGYIQNTSIDWTYIWKSVSQMSGPAPYYFGCFLALFGATSWNPDPVHSLNPTNQSLKSRSKNN